MARYYDAIGFGVTGETTPGIWEDKITERCYFGEVLKNTRSLQETGKVNDDIEVSNRISIIADPYANENFHAIRYAKFMGTKWKVTQVDASTCPRLILSLGGVYNGKQA
jgi:hypothetical protein